MSIWIDKLPEDCDLNQINIEVDGHQAAPVYIGAPVFDTEGVVALGVFILGFRDALTAEQVPDVAERLMKATGAITESIHGRPPR